MLKKKKKMVFIGILGFIIFLVGSYFYNNMTYIEKPLKKLDKAGFVEKQVKLKDGTILNYGEGPNNGKTPLLLIHGQGMTWEDYAKVLPKEKLLMGVPYYGWERAVEDGKTHLSNTLPEDDPDNYSSVISYGRAREDKEINKKQCKWDEYAQETWCWYKEKESGADYQVWLSDNRSVQTRYDFANKQNLGGIAIWTLGYDKDYPDLWDMIKSKFTNPK